jgi:elongation factor G
MATAKEFPTERIRNIAVLGHSGSGKSTLVDAICYTAGSSRRKASPDGGAPFTMTTPEEIGHGISIQVTPAQAEWLGTRLNLLDTPGYQDFAGEAAAAVRVADSAVIVLPATAGVEVGTERVWGYCEARGIPRILFVSMMDRENTSFRRVFQEIRERLTEKVIPVEIPIGEGPDFHGIVNLFSQRAHLFRPGSDTGEYDEAEVPEELKGWFEEWEKELQETLATTDERLLERYLEGGHISREEAIEGMARAMARGELVPLFCGSPRSGYGIRALMRKMVELLPHPGDSPAQVARDPSTGGQFFLECGDDAPFSALVYKTLSEPHMGELSLFRVTSGVCVNGMEVVNPKRGGTEKLNHLSILHGRERQEVSRLHAGDLGVVARLRDTHTNDTLASSARPLLLDPIPFPQPDIALAIRGVSRSDDDKLGEVLPRLHEEDPSFLSGFDPELGQTIARGLGELHLEIQLERLKRKFGVSVETERPRIAYRETITRDAEGHGRHKKQSGGRGQFGDCRVRFSPLPRGEGYLFADSIKGGVIPGKFVPSVDRGIQDAAVRGILAGFPLVDFRAELHDGSYHAVDSSDIAFKIAGSLAFQEGAAGAGAVLLEPIMEVSVATPDEYVGEVLGDITQRRGKVQGMEPEGGRTVVRARIPEAELYKYANALRSMTQGRAAHTRRFGGYEPVPDSEARGIIQGAREGRATAAAH